MKNLPCAVAARNMTLAHMKAISEQLAHNAEVFVDGEVANAIIEACNQGKAIARVPFDRPTYFFTEVKSLLKKEGYTVAYCPKSKELAIGW